MPNTIPCSAFWWDWWVNVAVALGTLSAVIVAIFGQAFRKKFFPPKLAIQLWKLDGEKTKVQFIWYENDQKNELKKDARYYHLRVSNSRRWSSANQVQVVLLQVDEPGPNQQLQPIWTGAIPLTWRHQEIYPPFRTIGASADIDLCSVIKDGDFQLHPLVKPFNLHTEWSSATTIVLHVQAQSSECDSSILRLKISWDGKWHDGAQEMRSHLIIEPFDEITT